jgi:hypothetical protein
MSLDDQLYFIRRAEQEIARAEQASCPEAAFVHRELAQAYRLRLGVRLRAIH